MSKLKKCTFCGGKAKVQYSWNQKEKYLVRCSECGFESKACISEAEAEDVWNRTIKCEEGMYQEKLF